MLTVCFSCCIRWCKLLKDSYPSTLRRYRLLYRRHMCLCVLLYWSAVLANKRTHYVFKSSVRPSVRPPVVRLFLMLFLRHSSKQDGSVSSGTWHGWAIRQTCPEPYIRRFAGYPRTGGAGQDVHVAPGFGPWKQTSSRSITVWTQPGDSIAQDRERWKQLVETATLQSGARPRWWRWWLCGILRLCCCMFVSWITLKIVKEFRWKLAIGFGMV